MNKRVILANGPSGSGKAQPIWEKVMTPKGFVQIKDLDLGDDISGEDGKTYKVKNIFEQGIRQS